MICATSPSPITPTLTCSTDRHLTVPTRSEPASSLPFAGLTHTPYPMASHLRLSVYAGAGRLVNMPESSCDYADGIEKPDEAAYRVVRHCRRLLRQWRDTRLLDLTHSH